MDTHTVAGFVHVAMRQFSLHRRKIDGWRRKTIKCRRHLEIIAWRFMFEIRYELNGVEIDCNRNVGIINHQELCINNIWRTTKLWLPWTQIRTLNPTRRKDTLIFRCRSTCCSVFAKITNAWSSTLATNWFWYEHATITLAWWEM